MTFCIPLRATISAVGYCGTHTHLYYGDDHFDYASSAGFAYYARTPVLDDTNIESLLASLESWFTSSLR
jgi:hypothetical protein